MICFLTAFSDHIGTFSNLGVLVLWYFAVTVVTLTDLGFLWFREFYLESSRVIQVR